MCITCDVQNVKRTLWHHIRSSSRWRRDNTPLTLTHSFCPLCRFWEHLPPHRRRKNILHRLRVARDPSVRLSFGRCRRPARHDICQGHRQSGENVCGESGKHSQTQVNRHRRVHIRSWTLAVTLDKHIQAITVDMNKEVGLYHVSSRTFSLVLNF